MEKRQRGKNFSEQEKSLLIRLITKHKSIIENKRTDNNTVRDKKRAWESISQEFNAFGGSCRSGPQLLNIYKSLKHKHKKNMNAVKVERYKTGGNYDGPNISTVDEKLSGLIEPSITPLNDPHDMITEKDLICKDLDIKLKEKELKIKDLTIQILETDLKIKEYDLEIKSIDLRNKCN